jgi:RNA polymerase-binding transcription factor DksA
MDTNDEIIYRTKKLLKRHDELLELINQQEEDLSAAEMLEKYPEVDNICDEIYEKYRYENEQFIISVPRGTRDIMNDGRQLHHCSASSERYFERINNRETFILFLRKTDRPLNAYYTLEIEPNGTVRQKRSEYNRQPEIKEVEIFIKEWQKEIRDRLNEDDIRTAKESKRKRIEEMAELQVKNVKLASILTEDLMEAI